MIIPEGLYMKTVTAILVLSCVSILLAAGATHAFPAWIGVYGEIERHGGGNQGVYTVLMNEDYWGLHAEVGINVNAGDWDICQMQYVGNQDGNSKWQYVPVVPYPLNSAVEFYFHGYDDWGGHIWDNDGGENHHFSIAGAELLRWTRPAVLPVPEYPDHVDMAVHGGMLYAAWARDGTVYFSFKHPSGPWQPPTVIDPWGSYPKIAACEFGIYVVYSRDYGSVYYKKSIDGGRTWSAESVAYDCYMYGSRYAALTVDGDYLYVVFNEFYSPDDSNIYFARMHRDAPGFDTHVFVMDHQSYKVTVKMRDIEVQGNIVGLSMLAEPWYGGYGTPLYGFSRDGGWTWSVGEGFAGAARIDIFNGNIYAGKVTDEGSGWGYYLTRNTNGYWEEARLIWEGADQAIGLSYLDSGLVAIRHYDGLLQYRTSQDDGGTWSESRRIREFDYGWIDEFKDVREGSTIHILLKFCDSPQWFSVSTTPHPARFMPFARSSGGGS